MSNAFFSMPTLFLNPQVRRSLQATMGASVLLAALAGCSDTGNNANGSGASSPPAAAPAANAASAASAPAPASNAAAASSAAGGAPKVPSGPVSVTLATAVKKNMPALVEATGTVAPISVVDVRPQTSSVVREVVVKEGDFVRKGQLLFVLDDRADVANLERAKAQLLKDEAAWADAQRQLTRSRELLRQNFVSQGAVDTNQALSEGQAAAVAASKAAVNAAEVSLSYSRITAPQSGRLGAISVFPGSFVSPTASPLVTITQVHPIAVSFSIPQRYLPDALGALKAASQSGDKATTAVTAYLPENNKPLNGRVVFVDNVVDAASGTLRVKAAFANEDQKLWPGAFVKVQFALKTLNDATVIPLASIVQSARGRSVMLVNAEGIANSKPIELIQSLGTEAAVKGLEPGDQVVLDGRQNVRNGNKVIERKGGGK